MSQVLKPLPAPRQLIPAAELHGVIEDAKAEEVEIYARPGTVFEIKGVQALHGGNQLAVLDVYIDDDFILQGPIDVTCFQPWGSSTEQYVPAEWGTITERIPVTLAVHAYETGGGVYFNFVLWGIETIVDEQKLIDSGRERRKRRG